MTEKPKTIRLREDQTATINDLKLNLSKWVREKFDEEFGNEEIVLQRITNCQKELKKLQKIHTNILQRNTKLREIGAEKVEFLSETKKLLKEKPEFIEGRIKLYKNTFGIFDRISKEKFMELLENVN